MVIAGIAGTGVDLLYGYLVACAGLKKEEEPKEKEFVTEKDLIEYRYPNRKKRQPLTEEEKEQRRLKAKQKKEAYEAREEKRRKEKEASELKARKAAHYQQKLSKGQTTQKKQAKNQPKQSTSQKKEDTRPVPKTVLGKFWRWLNT